MSFPPASTRIAVVLLAGLACTAALGQPETKSPKDPVVIDLVPAPAPSALSAELLYRLMVAEVAAQRGEAVMAAREFLAIARETRDHDIARRATEVALAGRAYPIAMQAATLWLELEPGSERAQRVVTALRASTGTLDEVREHLRSVIADAANGGANTPDAFLQLGRILAAQQDRVGVFRLVRELAQPYPKLPEAQFAIAVAGLGTGLADADIAAETLAAVDRALALRPGWDRGALLKAQVLARRSPGEALEWLRSFAEANPEARSVRVAFAQYLVEQRKLPEARAEFQRLIEADGSTPDLEFAIAVVSLQMRDFATAERLLGKLKERGFGEPGQVQANLAQVAEDSRQYELALQRYREVEEGDRWWLAQLKIGSMLAKLGRLDQARGHYAGLAPADEQQRVQLRQAEAQVLRDAGRDKEAFDLLGAALADKPDQPDLLYDLAMAAEKLGLLDETEKRLRRVIELQQDNAHALNALGYTLVDRTDRVREGYELIERAVKLAPNDPFILDSLGWAHYRMGNLDEGEKVLRRALSERQDPEIAAHLGEVLWAKGEREQARAVWQKQLADTPDHPLILETIRRLER